MTCVYGSGYCVIFSRARYIRRQSNVMAKEIPLYSIVITVGLLLHRRPDMLDPLLIENNGLILLMYLCLRTGEG